MVSLSIAHELRKQTQFQVSIILIAIFVAACGSARIAYPASEEGEAIFLPENSGPTNKNMGSHILRGDDLLFFEPGENIPEISGHFEQRETLSSQYAPYDISTEDVGWKRRARMQGMRMRMLFGPELTYGGAFIDAQEEAGSRNTIAAMAPLTEFWEGAAFDHVSFFSLKHGSSSAGREALSLRIGMNPGKTFRPWITLTPYFNFGEAEGLGLGIAAGISKTWLSGANLTGELFAWRPWDEGYYTIVEDGRKHGAQVSFTLPFTKKLILGGRAYYEELELGEGAKSGAQYAGNRYTINARAYYRLLHRDAHMGDGFRDDNLWNEFLIGSELGIFAQIDFQRYFKPGGFTALNPVPEVFSQEVGFSFQYAFSPHLGVTGEGFIGRDPDRDLQFAEIAGVNGRLSIVVNPHLRLWTGASYRKTSTTLESSGGEESTVSLGINYIF